MIEQWSAFRLFANWFYKMAGASFTIGDEVMKHTGDYQWRGIICAVFWTPQENLRYVVAHPVDGGYVLHIYSEKNLRRV